MQGLYCILTRLKTIILVNYLGYGHTISSNGCRDTVEKDPTTLSDKNEALKACLRLNACEGVTKYGPTEFVMTKACSGVSSRNKETYLKGNLTIIVYVEFL